MEFVASVFKTKTLCICPSNLINVISQQHATIFKLKAALDPTLWVIFHVS